MIKPTIGRVVLVFRASSGSDQFEPALISYVHSNTLINVGGFDQHGRPFAEENVFLDQEINVEPVLHGQKGFKTFACWMPYQKQQSWRDPR